MSSHKQKLPPKGLRVPPRVSASHLLAYALALAGAVYFLSRLLYFADVNRSILDEGLYLYKGFLYASGRYFPFQDYGPVTNQMPLSFLIPGWVQVLFGPGLRTGRTYAILLALLGLLGLWLTARRLGGPWAGTWAVWAIAITPAAQKAYSTASAHVLVACLLAWIFFLTLGEKRRLWQLLLGILLSVALVMVRINMLPLLPLLCLYVFWQHGWKTFLLVTGAGLAAFVLIHVPFWPGVLRLWAYWVPDSLTPFLDPWRLPLGAEWANPPDTGLQNRIDVILLGICYHFMAFFGAFTVWLLWPRRTSWTVDSHRRTAVYLSALFLALVVLHAWASTFNDYCVYCFPGYTNFYAAAGLLLVAVSAAAWRSNPPVWRRVLAVLLILLTGAAAGYARGGEIAALFKARFFHNLLSSRLPLLQTDLWQLFAPEYSAAFKFFRNIFFPALLGLGVGLTIILLAALFAAILRSRTRLTWTPLALMLTLAVGFVLLPTPYLGESGLSRCAPGQIEAYEAAGAHLAKHIPPGAQVYWSADAPTPLLYIPRAEIYPPQLNGGYNFSRGGDTDALLRYGWWDAPSARRWAAEADFIVIQQANFPASGWLAERLAADFEELPPAPTTGACLDDAYLRIFRRKP